MISKVKKKLTNFHSSLFATLRVAILITLTVFIFGYFIKTNSKASFIQELKFQAKIVDRLNGTNISPACIIPGSNNDTCDFRINIYANSIGGTPLWSETLTDLEIGQYDGIVSLDIGSYCNTNLGGTWTADGDGAGARCSISGGGVNWNSDGNYFVEIQFDDTNTSGLNSFADPEIFTRTSVQSIPYAFRAQTAQTLINNDGAILFNDINTGNIAFSDSANTTLPGGYISILDALNNLYSMSATSLWTTVGGITYIIDATNDLAIGGNDLSSTFSVDVSNNTVRIGSGSVANGILDIFASNGSSGRLEMTTADILELNNTGFVFNQSGDHYDFRIESDADQYLFFADAGTNRVGVGSSTLDAWLDIKAASLLAAQLNLSTSAGINPTSPVSGDLWWNGTNLYFYNGSSNIDILTGGLGASLFTDGGSITYLTSTLDDLAIGGTTLASPFSIDVSENTTRLGNGSTSDAILSMYASDGDTGSITYTISDIWEFTGGDISLYGNLYPGIDSTYNLGSNTLRWQDVFVSSGSIHIGENGNEAVLGYSTVDNMLNFDVDGDSTTEISFSDNGDINLTNSIYTYDNYQRGAKFVDAEVLGDSAVNSFSYDLAADNNYIYVTGGFQGNVDFDENNIIAGDTHTSSGSNDIFIAKYDNTNFTLQWVKAIGGTSSDIARSIQIDAAGNVYVVGSFSSTDVDFDEDNVVTNDTHTTAGGIDIFIAKYNSTGLLQWVKAIGGTTTVDEGLGVTVDNSGNVYATGRFFGSNIDFDEDNVVAGDTQSSVGTGGSDMFVAKYNSFGVLQWVKTAGEEGTTSDYGNDVAVDTSGNVYNVGYYYGSAVDFDRDNSVFGDTVTSLGQSDFYIAKYNSSGVLIWIKSLGGTSYEYVQSIKLSDNRFAVTGSFASANVDFDEDNVISNDTISTAGSNDIFISVYSLDGALQWVKGLGTSSSGEGGQDIYIDVNGNIFTSGYFSSSSMDFDEDNITPGDTHSSEGNTDGIIIKHDPNGEFLWVKTIGGTNQDAMYGIVLTGNYIYTSGFIASTNVDFDEENDIIDDTLSTSGPTNLFFAKYISQNFTGSDIGSLENNFANIYAGYFIGENASIPTIFSKNIQIGSLTGDTNSTLQMYSSSGDDGILSYTTDDIWDFENGDLGIGQNLISTTNTIYDTFYDWSISFNENTGNVYQIITAIDINPEKDLIVSAGEFAGTVDFNDSPTATDQYTYDGSDLNDADLFVSAYSTNKDYKWTNVIYFGSESFYPSDLTVDSEGNVYTVGNWYNATVDFDPSTGVDNRTAVGSTILNFFITKYSSTGAYLWTNTFAGSSSINVNSITVDEKDAIYISGSLRTTADLDPGVGVANISGGIFIAKYNSDGSYVWAKALSAGTYSDEPTQIESDQLGGIYFSGYFSDTTDFNPNAGADNHTPSGRGDLFLSKWTDNGDYLWTKTWGGYVNGDWNNSVNTENITGLAIAPNGDAFVTGNFVGLNVDFDTSSSTDLHSYSGNSSGSDNDMGDSFLTAYTKNGSYKWTRTWGYYANLSSTDTGIDVTTDRFSNVYTLANAQYSVSVDIDGTTGVDTRTYNYGDFIVKYSNSGAYEGAKFYEQRAVMGTDVEMTKYDTLYIIGRYNDYFYGSIDLDFSEEEDNHDGDGDLNGGDMYISKLQLDYFGTNLGTSDNFLAKLYAGTIDTMQITIGSPSYGADTYISMYSAEGEKGIISYTGTGSTGTGSFVISNNLRPNTDSAYNLGMTDYAFANVYADTYWGHDLTINNFDLAEEYFTSDTTIEPGTVVRLMQGTNQFMIEKAGGENNAYDTQVIGVVSTEPGLYLKEWKDDNENGRPVALAGRVPVKVTDENGPIKRGDFLTASSKPGYAMKATNAGMVIGRAMEDFPVSINSNGNSALVAQEIENSITQTEEIVGDMIETGQLSEAEAQEAITEVQNDINTTTDLNQTQFSEGRIMMFVDLGYVGEELFNTKSSISEAINVTNYELANGDNLFEIIEDPNGSTAKVKIDNIIIAGTVKIEGNLEILGDLKSNRIETNSLFIKDKLTLGKGTNSLSDTVTIPAGDTNIIVKNSTVTSDSIIYINSDQFSTYRIINIKNNESFEIEIDKPLANDAIFKYIIFN